MKLKHLAVGAIVAGSVLGALSVAPAIAHEGRYVTVLWQYTGYPDINQPQPFVSASDIISPDAFDEYLATPALCGTGWYQVDVYKTKLEDGTSWETLKASGSLNTSTDGAFLAYELGGTPYKVIEAPECAAPTPTPTVTPTPTSTPTSPTPTPSATTPPPSSSPEPPVTSKPHPSATATVPPATTSPTPVPTESSSVPPVVIVKTPSPSSSPSSIASNGPVNRTSSTGTSTPSQASVASTQELAYTGSDGVLQVWRLTIASLLLALGLSLIFLPKVIKHYRRR